MEKETKEPNVKSPDEVVIEEKVSMEETIPTPRSLENLPAEPKPKKRVGLAIMLVVLVLLLVGGALALGYLWGKNRSQGVTNSQSETSTDNGNSTQATDNTESQTEETAATEDTQVILLEKLKMLHSAANVANAYDDNIITHTTSYSYIPALYDNSLSDSMKVSIVLDSLELQPITDTSFVVNFLKTSAIEYRRKQRPMMKF